MNDLVVCISWLKSTYLWARMKRNPIFYQLPRGLSEVRARARARVRVTVAVRVRNRGRAFTLTLTLTLTRACTTATSSCRRSR